MKKGKGTDKSPANLYRHKEAKMSEYNFEEEKSFDENFDSWCDWAFEGSFPVWKMRDKYLDDNVHIETANSVSGITHCPCGCTMRQDIEGTWEQIDKYDWVFCVYCPVCFETVFIMADYQVIKKYDLKAEEYRLSTEQDAERLAKHILQL